MKTDRLFGIVALGLVVAEMLVILGSWMVSAVLPDLPIRSLISMEGVRWLFGAFTDCVATPLLVWLIVLAMAWGSLKQSGLIRAVNDVCRGQSLSYRERIGLTIVAGELMVAVAIMLIFTCLPHALLLNAMGHLYPSAFSASLVPYSALVIMCCAFTYGATSGRFDSVATAYQSLVNGLSLFAPLVPLYLLLVMVASSIRFVFSY